MVPLSIVLEQNDQYKSQKIACGAIETQYFHEESKPAPQAKKRAVFNILFRFFDP